MEYSCYSKTKPSHWLGRCLYSIVSQSKSTHAGVFVYYMLRIDTLRFKVVHDKLSYCRSIYIHLLAFWHIRKAWSIFWTLCVLFCHKNLLEIYYDREYLPSVPAHLSHSSENRFRTLKDLQGLWFRNIIFCSNYLNYVVFFRFKI